MDEDLQQLEAELKQLRPCAASPELQARIGLQLTRRRRAVWAWAALPLAATLALFLAPWFRPSAGEAPAVRPAGMEPGPVAAAEDYRPVAAEKLLYASEDEGVITLENGATARRVRHSYVDTITWRNPRTNASLRWSVPRDEVRVVPVSFQ